MEFLTKILEYHPAIPYVVLVVGFVALVKGADWFVDGASSVARKLGIPAIIVGLTIVAMGTSAPEAAVSISAALEKTNGIALGNVIGSNTFNLLIVLGVCMIITKVPTKKEIIARDFPWNIMASIVVVLFIIDGGISRIEGIILLVMFVTYIGYLVYGALKNREVSSEEISETSWFKSIILLIVGIVCIVAGGTCVVDSAKTIALSWGVDDTLVGLTIVACGTSLPELVTSIVAAKKGECDMAVGNVIGSNIFNLLFILGATTTITPITEIDPAGGILVDAVLLLGFTQLMLVFSQKESRFQKQQGAASVMCYIVYLAYIIMREFAILI